MPCQYCKSPSHTLAFCQDQSAITMFGAVAGMINSWAFNFRFQINQLKLLKKSHLSMVCKILGLTFSEPKYMLIIKIIDFFFSERTLSINGIQQLTPDDVYHIHNSYDELLMWNPLQNEKEIRRQCGLLLEKYYVQFFGVARNGRDLDEYLNQVQQIYQELDAQEQEEEENKEHLEKLKIKVSVDESLQVQECNICCDEKPNAKLGCGHEYCVDCVSNTAKVREKSFISCALCRKEISEVMVGTKEYKRSLRKQISEC